MGKWVKLDIDVNSKRALKVFENSCIKKPTSFITPVSLSHDNDGELLLPSEIDICMAPDVNRFKIYTERWLESRCISEDCTGWIINRKIFTREELIEKGMSFDEDASDRYFLTSDGTTIAVAACDESIDSYLERTSNKKEKKPVIGSDLFIKAELRTNSENISKSTILKKVKGENIATDFDLDEIVYCFFDEDVIRTIFFKYELTPDYDGNPHPGKQIYQTGWIYNGEAYDLNFASENGLINPNRAKEQRDLGYSRMVITKCGFTFMMNPEDMTFEEYLEKCVIKEGLSRKKD